MHAPRGCMTQPLKLCDIDDDYDDDDIPESLANCRSSIFTEKNAFLVK